MVHKLFAEKSGEKANEPPPMYFGVKPRDRMKRCYSLKRNKEFRRVYKAGRSIPSHTMVLIYLKGPADGVRVGFAVGKRIGGAVVRNRVKRRLREAVTPLLPEIAPGCRLIFVARSPITEVTYREIENTARRLVSKAGLIG